MIHKFRAWDKNQQIMRGVRGLFWTKNNLVAHCSPIGNKFDEFFTTILNDGEYHLMQSTGLLDKNDREIFEGDLLRDSESIVIVKFKDGEFIVDYRNMVGEWRNYGSLFSYLKDFEGEVIGDIYQNPELVEVE